MSTGNASAPRPQAATPSPKDAYPGQSAPSAPSAGSPHRRRLPSLPLGNKAAALTLTLLALTFIPAHHASAQVSDPDAPDNNLTYTLVEDASPNTVIASLIFGLPGTLHAGVFTVPQDTTGLYGNFALRFTINNRAEFTYTLDNNNPAVEALGAGESLTETFTVAGFQLTGPSEFRGAFTATVTINIQGGPPSVIGGGNTVTTTTSGGAVTDTLAIDNLPATPPPNWRTADLGMYGALTLNAATGAWTYALDNTRPATQALGLADTRVETFTATTTIAGTPLTATITINLNAGVFPDDPPTATAMINGEPGAEGAVDEGEMVTLTGTGTDPEGDPITNTDYQWAQVQVPDDAMPVMFTPANGQAQTVTFMAPEERVELTFTLTVTANGLSSPALEVTIQVGRSQFDNVNRAILPEVTRAMMDTTVSAIARRTEQAATDRDAAAGATFSLGGQSTLAGVLQSNGEALTTGAFNVKSLLGRSAFALPLNQAGGPLAGVTLWGNGAYRNLSGNSATVDWDGDLFGATVGGDAWLTDTLLTGLAVSWADGTFDYTDRSGADPAPGTYQATLTSLHPYVSTSLLDGQVTLWATGGYGWGEVEITDTADPTAEGTVTADTRLATAAVGGAGNLLNQPGLLTPDGTTTVRVKAEALTTAIKAEQQGDRLAGLTTDARRLRLTLEGSHEQPLPHGAHLTPSVGVGLRHDAGDGRTGTGAEVSGGLRYAHPALRLTLESRGRVLLAHGGDYDDWSVSGRVTLAPGAQGQGLAVTLAPTYQTTTSAGGLAQLWEHGTANRPAPSGPTTPQGLMEATVAYGLPVGDHLLTPYGGMTLAAADARTYRLGSRVSLAHRMNMSLEGARKGATGTVPVDHGVRVQLEWHW